MGSMPKAKATRIKSKILEGTEFKTIELPPNITPLPPKQVVDEALEHNAEPIGIAKGRFKTIRNKGPETEVMEIQ